MRVGYILGILRGFVAAWEGCDGDMYKEVQGTFEDAQKELAIEELLGKQWVDEEGIWKWPVQGEDEDATFREVSEQHPTVVKWMGVVKELAERWHVDLNAVEKSQAPQEDMS
jgi:hypothetical protein